MSFIFLRCIAPVAALLFTAVFSDAVPTAAGNAAIVPGRRIGQVRIGMDDKTVAKRLGKPAGSDGAMGHFWNTWFSRAAPKQPHYRVDVYSVRDFTSAAKGDVVSVQQIRVTSPYFVTASSISTRSRYSQIRHAFPQIMRVAYYTVQKQRVDLYDDEKQGIAFEIFRAGSRRCRALTVHLPGQSVTRTYLPGAENLTPVAPSEN